MKKALLAFSLIAIASCSGLKKNLVGYWYKPKTQINVRFFPNKTFEYNDYDSTANKSQKVTGTYKLEGNNVVLQFEDKTTQNLAFEKAANGAKGFQLKKDDYYMIKDEKVNNAVPPAMRSNQ